MEQQKSIALLVPAYSKMGVGNAYESIMLEGNRAQRILVKKTDLPYIMLRWQEAQALHNPVSRQEPKVGGESSSGSGESTLQPKVPNLQEIECLHLKLDANCSPKVGSEFIIGSAESCDIQLSPGHGISRRHCSILFDQKQRLILQDHSKSGTAVWFNGVQMPKRSNFRWILGGDRNLGDNLWVTLEINQDLIFNMIVYRHNGNRYIYHKDIDAWRAECNLNEGDASFIRRYSPPSPEAQVKWRKSLFIYQGELGKGANGVVRRICDVSTGIVYAEKLPREMDCLKSFENEIMVLKKIGHSYIVRLMHGSIAPIPRIIVEYAPFGTLYERIWDSDLSEWDTWQVLRQMCATLDYLHGHIEPIVHRDVKPSNILIQNQNPIHVKLADFGLAKFDDNLLTVCGTRLYMAPELYYHDRDTRKSYRSYTPLIDVWSLGVVILECADRFPTKPTGSIGLAWCENIITHAFQNRDVEIIDFVSRGMLDEQPGRRLTAAGCINLLSEKPSYMQGHRPTPQGPYSPSLADLSEWPQSSIASLHEEPPTFVLGSRATTAREKTESPSITRYQHPSSAEEPVNVASTSISIRRRQRSSGTPSSSRRHKRRLTTATREASQLHTRLSQVSAVPDASQLVSEYDCAQAQVPDMPDRSQEKSAQRTRVFKDGSKQNINESNREFRQSTNEADQESEEFINQPQAVAISIESQELSSSRPHPELVHVLNEGPGCRNANIVGSTLANINRDEDSEVNSSSTGDDSMGHPIPAEAG
ncbi:hypothetical protein MMC25_007275 [Agyrium rufum]|nr:hypothetical protein [Agyrium rufum]